MKTRTIRQNVVFKTSPHEIYEALMDSKKHSKFTKSKCVISRKKGGKFSAYDGFITGKNLKLVKDKRIEQLWKGKGEGWPKNHFSKVTFALNGNKKNTKLSFTHSGVPSSWASETSKGWNDHYWKPMKKMLE